MANEKLTFIGGGNMASSIIGGLVAKGYDPKAITACDPVSDNLAKLEQQFGVHTATDNAKGVAGAEAVILAVKPQIMGEVCRDLAAHLSHKPVMISIAAGITTDHLSQWLGEDLAIIRCMPNTPSLVQQGAAGLYANVHTSEHQKNLADQILSAVGIVEWLEEEALLDAVTAVSGSAPAYFFLMMEAMIEAGVNQGLPRDTAGNLAIQACLGAGTLARHSDVDVAELRRRVSSPGGTTLKALESFNADGFEAMVERAMQACADRAQAMSKEFS